VELALAARHALAASRSVQVGIVSATAMLSGGGGPRLQRRLRAAGIVVHKGMAVRIDERAVHLAEGASLGADGVIVATGSAAPPWIAASGLPVDGAGYARVGPTLGVIGQPAIFAAGDCASIEGRPQPRSGVHALRMGPALLENLRRSVAGAALVTYAPRQRALHLISVGDRYAIGTWGGIAFEGRWVWRWKDRIDRAFIARHAPGGTG
jgi:NADH dehydrogenase FAD-containing subunit